LAPEDYEKLATLFAKESAVVRGHFAAIHDQFASVHDEFAWVRDQFASIHDQFASVRDEFTSVHDQFASVHDEFTSVRSEMSSMRGEMSAMNERMGRMDDRLAKVEITGEQTRHLVEIVADGVTTADGKVEGLRTDMNRGFEDVREVMAVGFGAHDVRLRRIEGGSTA